MINSTRLYFLTFLTCFNQYWHTETLPAVHLLPLLCIPFYRELPKYQMSGGERKTCERKILLVAQTSGMHQALMDGCENKFRNWWVTVPKIITSLKFPKCYIYILKKNVIFEYKQFLLSAGFLWQICWVHFARAINSCKLMKETKASSLFSWLRQKETAWGREGHSAQL